MPRHPSRTKRNNGANLGFEQTLWQAADKLRGHMDAAEYKHVVLGLIFLKYISDAFQERHSYLLAATADPKSEVFMRERETRYKIVEDRDEYISENIFWVPKGARWSSLQANAKQPTIGKLVDDAMVAIEKDNPSLKGVLPKDYGRPALDKHQLGELIDLIGSISFQPSPAPSPNGRGEREARGEGRRPALDILGRVYEYFLSQFASAEGKKGGEFYTPRCVVKLLVEMIEPYKGRVYDPCCGSSGMFVQSEEFILAHGGRLGDISIFGQESNPTTWRLAKMNLAIRRIEANLGPQHADTFHHDLHKDLKADFILANPPFNMSDWGGNRLREDVRWKYGVPPVGNANFAWVQHLIHHLAPNGIAGFVLANGSMSSNQSGEGEIRKNIVEADLVDCMIALPGQLFYGTQIPACLWFLSRNKANGKFRDRRGETLFIDARKLGHLVDRTHRDLSDEEIARIAKTYHLWRGGPHPASGRPLPEGEGHYRGGFDFSGLVETARELRKNQTPAESIMWQLLRDRRLAGLKFRRQHQIGKYIVDFFCDEKKLVLELDGAVHDEQHQAEKDTTRDAYLQSTGLTILRFRNEDVISRTEHVLRAIAAAGHSSTAGRGVGGEGVVGYRDIPGFCKSATLEDIRAHGHVLTPGRYVGAEEAEEDGEPFEDKMTRLTATLEEQFAESAKLEAAIRENLKGLRSTP